VPIPPGAEKAITEEAEEVLGDSFPLDITIPAYQAGLTMSPRENQDAC
jgi:hypothetical protein